MSICVRARPWVWPSLLLVFSLGMGCVRAESTDSSGDPDRPITTPTGVHTYSTVFPLRENPISEDGHWVNGGETGLDWTDVSTVPGLAIGHQCCASYTDATALLAGSWGPDQEVTATVHSVNPNDACAQEVELRLRSAIAPHSNRGYEVSFKASRSSAAYLIIVRWDGPYSDFTYLLDRRGAAYGVSEGDVVTARIIGDEISAYKNGVLVGQASDTTWADGSPGLGFNLESAAPGCAGSNGDYGFTAFAATDHLTP